MDADVGLVVESDLVAEAELDLGHDGAYGQRVQRAAHHLRAALEGPVVGHGDDLVGKEGLNQSQLVFRVTLTSVNSDNTA